MSLLEKATPPHWNYFLALEEDITRISRYIEIAEKNFDTHSVELLRILMAAASEIDVVSKCLCLKLSAESKADNINKYCDEIIAGFPEVVSSVVEVPRFGVTLTPWAGWHSTQSPTWWRAYNNVKHRRHIHYSEATLKNALNAVAGLFLFLLFYYRDEALQGYLTPNPVIFRAGAPFVVDTQFYRQGAFVYKLG